MSIYRIVSTTDVASTSAAPEPDLKFSIKGFELDRTSATCTPKGFDYVSFQNPLKEEYLPSEGSVIDDELGDELIVYGDNEILDFDSAAYKTTEVPKREQRRLYSTKEPLSIDEMKRRAPDLFIRNISLDDYFSVEQNFAFNLKQCHMSICPTDKYSTDLFMKPVSSRLFYGSGGQYATKLQQIMEAFHKLEESCINLNNTIEEEYNLTKSSLKWEIFSNSTSNKNFENGRSMFEALLEIKTTFQKFIHESDLWMELDESINEFGDLIAEWNELEIHGQDMDDGEDKMAQDNLYIDSINLIESSLRPNSNFIRENCSNFEAVLDEVKILYEDFLCHFKMKENQNGLFEYEICLFDDHIKEKKRQHSC